MSARARLGVALVALVAVTSLGGAGVGVGRARAQACCSGGGALTPWRLEHHEGWLVGLATRVTPMLGSFDADAVYRASPDGVRETEAEARLLGSARLHERVQLGVQVPFLLIDRTVRGDNATGFGIADVALGVRWDPIFVGERSGLPAIGLELGVVAPTGTAIEDSRRALAVDATGLGAWQFGMMLALEHVLGADGQWLLSLRGGFDWRAPRTVDGVEVQPGIEGRVSLGGALVLTDLTLAARLDWSWEGGDEVAGVATDRRLLALGLVLAVPLSERWRALASVASPLPIDELGQNRAFGIDLGLTVVFVGW